jgi:hypothetical protein
LGLTSPFSLFSPTSHNYQHNLANYLAEVLKQVNWYPELLYTVDICESEGELYILELGSFSCAGEYGCDLSLIVEVGAKAAWEDYEAVNS